MSVHIICPYCYSTDVDMYMEGLSSASGMQGTPVGNLTHNNMNIICRTCGHVFKPGEGKIVQEPGFPAGSSEPAGSSSLRSDEAFLLNMCNTKGKIAAIKYCVGTRGWGLKASKDYIDALTGALPEMPNAAPAKGMTLNEAEVNGILQEQGKLQVVKFVKDKTGMGLKESKDYADQLAVQHAAVRGKKEGCFIATACYGDYDAPEVRLLRRYRDEVLQQSIPGRLFIRLYYFFSPSWAIWLSRSGKGRQWVRQYGIAPLLRMVCYSRFRAD